MISTRRKNERSGRGGLFPGFLPLCFAVIVAAIVGCTSVAVISRRVPQDSPTCSFIERDRLKAQSQGLAYFLPLGKVHIVATRIDTVVTNFGLQVEQLSNGQFVNNYVTKLLLESNTVTRSGTTNNFVLQQFPATVTFSNVVSTITNYNSAPNVSLTAATNVTLTITSNSTISLVISSNQSISTTLSNVAAPTSQTVVFTTVIASNAPATFYPASSVSSNDTTTTVTAEQPALITNHTYIVTVAAEYEADPSNLFILDPQLDNFHDDDVSLTVDGNGLLSTLVTSNTDQTGGVIETLAQTAIQSFELAASGGVGALGGGGVAPTVSGSAVNGFAPEANNVPPPNYALSLTDDDDWNAIGTGLLSINRGCGLGLSLIDRDRLARARQKADEGADAIAEFYETVFKLCKVGDGRITRLERDQLTEIFQKIVNYAEASADFNAVVSDLDIGQANSKMPGQAFQETSDQPDTQADFAEVVSGLVISEADRVNLTQAFLTAVNDSDARAEYDKAVARLNISEADRDNLNRAFQKAVDHAGARAGFEKVVSGLGISQAESNALVQAYDRAGDLKAAREEFDKAVARLGISKADSTSLSQAIDRAIDHVNRTADYNKLVVAIVNRIISNSTPLDVEQFRSAGVLLRPETVWLGKALKLPSVKSASQCDQKVQLLNRMLLEDAFPRKMVKAQSYWPLSSPPPPLLIDITFNPFDSNEWSDAVAALKAGGIEIRHPETFTNAPDSYANLNKLSQKKTSGVYYRPPIPYQLCIADSDSNVTYVTVLLPNKAPILHIDFGKSSLVTKVTQITMTNGFITSYCVSKPSSAMALAQIPLTIVSGLTGAVTNLVELKFNLASTQSSTSSAILTQQENEAASISNQIFLLNLQKELNQALAANKAGSASSSKSGTQ